jgi:DNA-binding response OmpR family regulator
MSDPREEQARFNHLFSSPLTAMRGAIDLLRRPRRMADDPLTRELLETLERSCTRLREVIDVLLAHTTVAGDQVEITAPLSAFGAASQQPGDAIRAVLDAAPMAGDPTLLAGRAALTHPAEAATVLVVEDSPTYRAVLRMVLTGAGYTVLEAIDGVQAIDVARQHRPDLILLDLELPLLSGQQVAQVLREDPETKAIPLIYASGYERMLTQLPPDAEALPKPTSPLTLLQMVQQAIAAGRGRAEQPLTLLIIDDDPDIQRILHATFRDDGYRIISAGSGAEALMQAQKRAFDLIVLDLVLPDIDGFSVLGALRARPATALTPILLLSARDSAQEKVHGLQLGADDYVTKPFSPDELRARVRAALRRRELEGGANPSTRLPGNLAIERAIRSRIEHQLPFAVCYADLDNFKAYNDTYGFLKGDAVIQHTAHVLLTAVERHGNRDDFVGHIGGDDFVVITTPDRVAPICSNAIAAFDALAPMLYDPATRARGYIEAHDRQGRPARFPFVSLSIAVVSTAYRPFHHLAEVAQRAIELKKRVKEIAGSAYVIEG